MAPRGAQAPRGALNNMAYKLIAPPGLSATLLPEGSSVLVSWSPYGAADAAGHQVIGYRLFRSASSGALGTLIADEKVLNALSTSFSDVNEPIFGQDVFYTLVAVEASDFGARPFGEGGNVPYGA